MKILNAGTDIDLFLDRLSCSEGRLLMLDYDGTLSPYQVERHKAVPYPGIREILEEALAAKNCRTVIISGRSISDLTPLLGIDTAIEIWGCHGWERLSTEGKYTGPDLRQSVISGLREAKSWAYSQDLEDRLEVKAACLAIHWRGLDEADISALERSAGEAWSSIARGTGLTLQEFNGGLELRPKGINKGTVVEIMLEESEGPAAYLGDDMTDEDAFRAISGRGLGILVSHEIRKTYADIWLTPPGDLIWFLERWVASCGGGE